MVARRSSSYAAPLAAALLQFMQAEAAFLLRSSRANRTETSSTLSLVGATCSDPYAVTPPLPKYCCKGIMPDPDYVDSCECNPGWTHEECVCKAYLTQQPCHQCMVHLPDTNRWQKVFSKSELYDNCKECVGRCKTDFEGGQCSSFMADVFARHFAESDPAEVLCTGDYLKSQVTMAGYPTDLKRSLYKAPRLRSDDEYHQPSDWKVAGVR
eukprot:TRINITY_DN19091_c0_g1_i1.p1 TRINITY_DN19091_c0_g1~~TRINITY_DN19091_c0_g1_i1.p1  ORF type:complete len:211 (-),score=50.86 TRINITY_DN19091_c0_g1_i1:119-751(-)